MSAEIITSGSLRGGKTPGCWCVNPAGGRKRVLLLQLTRCDLCPDQAAAQMGYYPAHDRHYSLLLMLLLANGGDPVGTAIAYGQTAPQRLLSSPQVGG